MIPTALSREMFRYSIWTGKTGKTGKTTRQGLNKEISDLGLTFSGLSLTSLSLEYMDGDCAMVFILWGNNNSVKCTSDSQEKKIKNK